MDKKHLFSLVGAVVLGLGAYYYFDEPKKKNDDLEVIVNMYEKHKEKKRKARPITTTRRYKTKNMIEEKVVTEKPKFDQEQLKSKPPLEPKYLEEEDPEDDNEFFEERPSYDKPDNERNFKDIKEALHWFYESLEGEDYRVTEGYVKNVLEHIPPESQESSKDLLLDIIVEDYDRYLSDVIENCDKYNQISFNEKATYMNVLFFHNHENEEKRNRNKFIQKTAEAMKSLEGCQYE